MQHYSLSAEISGLQVRVLPGSPLILDDLTTPGCSPKKPTAGTFAGTLAQISFPALVCGFNPSSTRSCATRRNALGAWQGTQRPASAGLSSSIFNGVVTVLVGLNKV